VQVWVVNTGLAVITVCRVFTHPWKS